MGLSFVEDPWHLWSYSGLGSLFGGWSSHLTRGAALAGIKGAAKGVTRFETSGALGAVEHVLELKSNLEGNSRGGKAAAVSRVSAALGA